MSQRSEPFEGQDIDQDSYAGYAGNPGWFTWNYMGEKTILGSFHSEKIPVEWHMYPMGHNLCAPEVRDVAVWLKTHVMSNGMRCTVDWDAHWLMDGKPSIKGAWSMQSGLAKMRCKSLTTSVSGSLQPGSEIYRG